jgi:hypothetical protein
LHSRKLSVREAAQYLGLSKSLLDKKRLDGTGAVYLKLGRRVLYDIEDLEKMGRAQQTESHLGDSAAGLHQTRSQSVIVTEG